CVPPAGRGVRAARAADGDDGGARGARGGACVLRGERRLPLGARGGLPEPAPVRATCAGPRPDEPLSPPFAGPARQPAPVRGGASGDPRRPGRARPRSRGPARGRAHPSTAAASRGAVRRGALGRGAFGRGAAGVSGVAFGVNLNTRGPLIAADYDLQMLLDLSEVVEASGFDSVWVGDSLFSKPRYEPIALLSAISQRTSHVRLGTSCMVSSTRNPLYLALEWATLDVISGGRTILGTGMGNPEEGVRREFEALGLDYVRRGSLFEEGLEVLRTLWTEGRVTFHGRYFDYDD